MVKLSLFFPARLWEEVREEEELQQVRRMKKK